MMFVKGNDGRASKKARDRQFANSKRCFVGLMLMITFAYYVWTDNDLIAIKHNNFRKSTNREQSIRHRKSFLPKIWKG